MSTRSRLKQKAPTAASSKITSKAKTSTSLRNAPPAEQKRVKPGLFAPAWEKQLYAQVAGTPDPAAIHAIGQQHPPVARTVAMVEILCVALPSRQMDRVRALAGWLFAAGYDPSTDVFIGKYVTPDAIEIPIAVGVTASMSWDRQALGLLAAELEQEAGLHEKAIALAEDLEPTTIAAVSLAELYAERQRWSDVVDLTNGLSNDDEAATFLLIQRGAALREQGYFEAAREALKEALRVRSRPAELRHLAWMARGHTYLAEGKRSLARKDFERVLAEDARYPGLNEMLAAVTA